MTALKSKTRKFGGSRYSSTSRNSTSVTTLSLNNRLRRLKGLPTKKELKTRLDELREGMPKAKLDFKPFFEDVKIVREQFESITKLGVKSKISLRLKTGSKEELLHKILESGRLNILLLNNLNIFSGKSIKETFTKNEGLVFYRSVYVEHLIKVVQILKIICKKINTSTILENISKLEDIVIRLSEFKSQLEVDEESDKIDTMKFFEEEEAKIDRYYESKSNANLLTKIIRNVKKHPEKLRHKYERYIKRSEYYKSRGTKSIMFNTSGKSLCDVAKTIFYGYKPPFNTIDIRYNGLSYKQQLYKKTDSDSEVKEKLKYVFEFVSNNETWLITNGKTLSKKSEREEYIAYLESNGGCSSIVIMLKFFDKTDGGGGTGVSDSSLADMETRLISLTMPDVPKGTLRSRVSEADTTSVQRSRVPLPTMFGKKTRQSLRKPKGKPVRRRGSSKKKKGKNPK